MKLIEIENIGPLSSPIEEAATTSYTVQLDAVAVAYIREVVGKTAGYVSYSKSDDLGVDLLTFFQELLEQENINSVDFLRVDLRGELRISNK